MSEPSAARELFRRSFGESFGEDAGVFRAADFDPGLDDCSSDEEEAARKRVPAEDTETPKKKQHWVDPERQVDKELLLLCQGRVRRRAELIDTIRRAYLQDVVLLKSIVMQQFNEVQTETVARQWRDAIPSLDVRQLFWLHAPDETTLAVLPCKTCGGSVELMHHDSPEIERLTKLVAMQEHQSHDLKILVATQKAKLETAEFQLQDATNSHLKEKQVMFGKMRDLRAHADGVEARHEKCAEDLKATAGRLERLQASTADYREVVDARKRLEIEAINLNTALSQRSDALVKESALLSSANEEIMVLKKQAIASQSALSKASAQIEELNISVNKATKVYEQAEARYEKTQGFLDDLRREFTQLEAAKNSLAIDLSMLEETSSREIEQFEARQASLKAQNKRLTSDLAISRDMADLLRAKLEMENPDALNNAHEEQVFRLQDELATANAEIQRLKAELENVPVSGLSLANSFVSQSSAGAVKANEPPHAKSNSQSHTRPQAASTSYSVQKKAPPRAIITQQSSDELRREEAAWQAGSQSMDSEAPPPPELPPASLNDTPHPERLIKPFFQTFASEDNDLMAEQSDEDMSSGDSDIFTDEDHSAAEIIKQPIDKSRGKPKGGAPPPTPKKSGGGFGKDFPEEGTAISPGSLPATAAINRRKSLSFAEQARSDSITEADETEAAAVLLATRKYKLVKRKVKKLVKIKRVVKVWIKRRSIALVDALVPSAELSVDMGTDVLPAAHNLSVAGSRESVAPSSSERTPPPFDDSDTEVVTNQPSSRPVSAVEAIEEVNASTPGSPAKLADGSTVSSIPISSCDDAAIARTPPSHQAESASVSGPPVAQDTEVVNKKEEIDAARAEDVAGARDSFTEKEKTFEATTADLIEPPCVKRHVMEVILRSAPPIEDMELYEEVEREIEEEVRHWFGFCIHSKLPFVNRRNRKWRRLSRKLFKMSKMKYR